jgi:hypothetical protein
VIPFAFLRLEYEDYVIHRRVVGKAEYIITSFSENEERVS